jgi:hypothetical protein
VIKEKSHKRSVSRTIEIEDKTLEEYREVIDLMEKEIMMLR